MSDATRPGPGEGRESAEAEGTPRDAAPIPAGAGNGRDDEGGAGAGNGRDDEGGAGAVEATPDRGRPAELWIAAGFAVSAVAAAALALVYWRGGQPQLEGLLLALALGGLGTGFVTLAHHLLPGEEVEQERHPLGSAEDQREAIEEDMERTAPITRRKLLTRLLGLAAAALAAAFAFPIRSLGPGPGNTLRETPWRRGSRVVDEKGRVVRADDVPVGALVTVFPEGHTDAADAQTVLVRVEEGLVKAKEGREDWSPEGFVAYSKICTHAGCPVGLYQADTHELLCPCHQSAFDVLDGARPVFGPATRPLPQLPLRIGRDGVLEAGGEFEEPVGPTFWNLEA